MRSLLVAIKHQLDTVRAFVNLYDVILFLSPVKKHTARLLGAIISPSSRLHGSVALFEPAWFQMNRNAQAGPVTLKKNSFLLIDHDTARKKCSISVPTIITSEKRYENSDRLKKTVTISVDLEGGVGLSHASKKQFDKLRPQWNSLETARSMYAIFKKHSLPVTWAACGHLFLDSCNGMHGFDENDRYGEWFTYDPASDASRNPDWYMPGFLRTLAADNLMEIGYHSFGHFNFTSANDRTISKDLAWAHRLRNDYGIPLKTLVFPYNAVSHLSEAVAHGFRFFRGYIGQYYLPLTVDFGDFVFYGTSMFVGPANVSGRIRAINECCGRNFNYFLHPENWVGCDLSGFDRWCAALAELCHKRTITISILGKHETL